MSDNSNPQELSAVKRALVEIRDLRARLVSLERRQNEPIAIVGMGMRFPGGASDPESFWRLLHDGVHAISEVPAERWNVDALYDPDPERPGTLSTRYGGFLKDIDQFDARFFNISPREAESMDPQQRLLLEVTWEALEHAGQPPDKLFETQAGVFLGISNSDYLRLMLEDAEQIDAYVTTGSTASVAAGRLSYALGLRGPSIALDTACSSSLVAIHLAVQSLRRGECHLALAGGVNLILSPEFTINFSKANMMAPDGRCKTFDAAADGYVRSEGCGMVVLKRLSDAVAAGDRVLAVVRGSAVNQDGRSGGITAPNGPAQGQVIAAALADAGAAAHAVDYVETHGTGTALGDPIEVRALVDALYQDRPAGRPLVIGSVKTNLGHLEAAAGIAGLIKAVLALQHKEIPPHLHLNELNPHIAAIGKPLLIPNRPTPWPAGDHPRIAGVSSFGLSGTNAHVIVEEAPAAQPAAGEWERPSHLLALSARTDSALRALAARYAAFLDEFPDLPVADVAYSANTGRAHLSHRLALLADSSPALRTQLEDFAARTDGASGGQRGSAPEVVFLFTGHGSHYAGMGAELYASQPVFRAALDRCDALLRPLLDRTLPEILFAVKDAGETSLLDRMEYAQPALFALQIALAELWMSWGVRPSMVAGHSAGEYAAAVIAGVLSLEDGLRLIAARGRLMQSLPPDGEMVALFVDEARAARAVAPYAGSVSIAAVNGPTTTVISGRRDAVQAVLDDMQLDADDLRRLDVGVAAHSPLVEPILDDFESVAAGISFGPPQIGLVSSMTGALVGREVTEPRYWRRHLREPVRFAAVFDTLRQAGFATFVEIGPHPTLLGLGQRCWPDASGVWAPSLRRGGSESTEILEGLATLYRAGVEIDWAGFDRPYPRRKLALPTYAWDHERYWSPAALPGARAPKLAPPEESWPAAGAAAQRQADQGPLDLHLDTFARSEALLDRLALAYIVRALRGWGIWRQPGERWSAEALMAQHGIAPTYRHLIDRWLEELADEGIIQREEGGFYSAAAPLPDLPVEPLLEEARGALAGSEPLLAYVRRCGERLADVLVGQESPLVTLFPDGSYETVDFLYNRWAPARYFNAIARAAAEAAAKARAGHPLRVVEIGAGTGGTTAALLPALPAARTRYTFTDVSDFFLTRAAERFAAYTFVEYRLLDVENPLEAHGFAPHAYDLVVAANVLHATRDLDVTLRHTLSLLAPGGLLLLYEATRHPRWLSVTTGLIEGWQRFEDPWRMDQPLLPAAQWEAALRANGFADVLALPAGDHPAAVMGQHVLLARAPGSVQDAPPAGLAPAVSAPHVQTDAAAVEAAPDEPAALRAALAGALPDERLDLLVAFVRQSIARVLRIRQWQSLQRDQPLLDLGFDSLMAVELRNVLRQGLNLSRKLPATLVFDYPSISALAAYLDQLLGDGMPGEGEAQPAPPAAAPAGAPPSAAEIAALSDAEVEAMLLKKLEQM